MFYVSGSADPDPERKLPVKEYENAGSRTLIKELRYFVY
jgi:hypothetical protein